MSLQEEQFEIISTITNKNLICGIKRYGFVVALVLTMDKNNIVTPHTFSNIKQSAMDGMIRGLVQEKFLLKENGSLLLNTDLIKSKPERAIRNKQKKLRKKKKWRKKKSKYYDYLGSPEWQKVRGIVHKRDVVCINCGADKNLQVHHKTYKYFKDELNHLDSVVLVCGSCHQKVHGINGKKKIKLKANSTKKAVTKNSILRERVYNDFNRTV